MLQIDGNMLPRPHKLYVQKTTPIGFDADGFELSHDAEWVFWCDCRKQSCKQPHERQGVNGVSYLCSSMVFVDCNTPVIEQGTKIKVVETRHATSLQDGERVILEGDVKEFELCMYYTRIWV